VFLGKMLKVVADTKNLRSHLTSIRMTVGTAAEPTAAAVAAIGHQVTVSYAVPDLDLLMEGAVNGMAETEAAVEKLRTMLHERMPTQNYW
jgi:hypothetical protein